MSTTKPVTTNKPINLQENFLNQARKENVPVTIHLVNGFQLKGVIRGFDQFTVIIDTMGRQQMIFKHAISTITPARPLGAQQQAAPKKDDAKPAEAAPAETAPAEAKAE